MRLVKACVTMFNDYNLTSMQDSLKEYKKNFFAPYKAKVEQVIKIHQGGLYVQLYHVYFFHFLSKFIIKL